DYHASMNDRRTDPLVDFLEKKYLPRSSYLTAASPGIGGAYATRYGLAEPVTILNTFPLERLDAREANRPVKLYWYSQVIGPNRGLETLMKAVAGIDRPFELHLRGSLHSQEYKLSLGAMAGNAMVSGRIFFHEPILAEAIIADANQ